MYISLNEKLNLDIRTLTVTVDIYENVNSKDKII